MTTVRFRAAKVRAIMDRTDQLMCEAAGWNPLGGVLPEQATYTRSGIERRLNSAADAICCYGDSGSIRQDDMANLSVNITGWFLDHPDRIDDATIEEIIEDQYSTDPEEVLGWVR